MPATLSRNVRLMLGMRRGSSLGELMSHRECKAWASVLALAGTGG